MVHGLYWLEKRVGGIKMKCPYCNSSKLILTGGFVQASISIDCYKCYSCDRELAKTVKERQNTNK